MAFIDKKDPVVLNIKLTSKGRELLSEGNLNFKYYAIGDSEIDYEFNSVIMAHENSYAVDNPFSAFNLNILRPADKNPSQLSFIPRNLSGDTYNSISVVPSTPTIIQNSAQPLGFFTISTGTTSFITDSDHVKQPDAMVNIDLVTGGTKLKLFKAPTYIGNVAEPIAGDLLLVKWTNPLGIDTTGYTVNLDYPTPYLIYKIMDVSHTLASNNLVVTVDRELPNFTNVSGGTSGRVAGALIYYNYINYTGTSIFNDYSTSYVDEAVTSFLQNCQCPTITFPFWNMSIVYTEEILGVNPAYFRNYEQFKSRVYGGFVSYIQNQAPLIKKMGIIHYTNSSPSNTYAEELYQNTPTLNLPTVMWHKSLTNKMGLTLKAYGSVKMLTGVTKSLNTTYYDLADLQGNVVGKIFNDLKLFVIEDPELLFAMSYKSNRSWTLPNYTVGINDNVVIGCQSNAIMFHLTGTSPTHINSTDGILYIKNISGGTTVGMLIEVSGMTQSIVHYGHYASTKKYLTLLNVIPDTYRVNIYDLGTMNAPPATDTYVLSNPTSILNIKLGSSASGLNPNFKITQVTPTTIQIYKSDVGTLYGTGFAGYKVYGASDTTITWLPFTGTLNLASFNLSFNTSYTIAVKDVTTGGTFIVSRDYISVGTPFKSTIPSFLTTVLPGRYVSVSSYLTTINSGVNPVVGTIEFSIFPATSTPFEWVTLSLGAPLGSTKSLLADGLGSYYVAIRERKNNIVMYLVTKLITVTDVTTSTTTTTMHI